MPDRAFAPLLMGRLQALAALSDEPGRLTRLYLGPAYGRALALVGSWMEAAGLAARVDAAGNLLGRYEGTRVGAPALLLGSHLDTVVDAGRFDGALGVLVALAAVEDMVRRGWRPRQPLEVVAFGDEEGIRFPTALTGSRALAGTLDPAILERADAQGVTLRDALRAGGMDPDGLAGCARRPGEVAAWLEVHIEQGPVLEALGLPLGVVTAIAGASRFLVEVTGKAGHAGTVPMELRRDALAAAAEMILAAEHLVRGEAGLVATVGRLTVEPGVVNTIPGFVRFSVDLRSPSDARRAAAYAALDAAITGTARARGVEVRLVPMHESPAVTSDPRLLARLEAAIAGLGCTPHRLVSGAGHDAVALAALAPVAMLFVRCRGGISHHPAEWAEPTDIELAVRALQALLGPLVDEEIP